MRNKEENKQKFVRVSPETHKTIKVLAAEFGLTLNETIKKLVVAYQKR